MPYGGAEGAEQPVQKMRDVIKSVTAMTDKRAAYLLLAIEAQSHVHYAMAVKNMVYDALQYAKQVEKAIVSHKLSGDYKGVESDEFLSGFMKGDHLIPVVTLTILFDPKTWDAPVSIHEMFGTQDVKLLSLVPDYRINLIAPASMEDSNFDKFKTTLKEVLSFIKYSSDKDKLGEVLAAGEGFHHLGRSEVDVLNVCVGAKLTIKEGEEAIDLCKALEDMKTEERITTLLNGIKKLMKNMGLSVEQSMDALEVSEDDRKQLSRMLH